mgnify:FL=1
MPKQNFLYTKTLPVRLHPDDYRQFANLCAYYGLSCSEAVRRFISDVITNGQFYGGHEILKLNLTEAIEYGRKTTSYR